MRTSRWTGLLLVLGVVAACREPGLRDAPRPPPAPRCGDGKLDEGEQCDGSELDGQSCVSEGFDLGALTCSPQCTLDASRCIELCGNSTVDPGEACDGTVGRNGPLTCATWGFLRCGDGCAAVNAARCVSDAFPREATTWSVDHGGAGVLANLGSQGSGELVVALTTPGGLQRVPWVSGGWGSEGLFGDPTEPVAMLLPLAVDLNADDRLDLAAITADGEVRTYVYDPQTRGYPERMLKPGACAVRAWVGSLPRPAPTGLDLVVRAECPASAPTTRALLVLDGTGAGEAKRLEVAGLGAAALADLDGDGRVEVLHARDGEPDLHTREWDGAAFGPESAPIPLGGTPTAVVVADFDRDGRADVAVAAEGQVQVLRNGEDGLTSAWRLPGSTGQHLLVADVDGDDRQDLAWLDGGELKVARNETPEPPATGSIAFRVVTRDTRLSGESLSLSAGDLDGDGDLDLAATFREGTPGSQTAVLLNGVR